MILTHYTRGKMNFDPTLRYQTGHEEMPFKPAGLWLSDDSSLMSWWSFCRTNNFNKQRLKHRTYFGVDLGRWIVLRNSNEVVQFAERFKRAVTPGSELFTGIHWSQVKDQYAGILITPYQWSLRLDPRLIWYYGWDCASGCAWDLSTVKLIKTEETKHGAGNRAEHAQGVR